MIFKKSIFDQTLRVGTIEISGINTKEIIIMKCPTCEKFIEFDWLETECIEPNEEFNCPHCDEVLRYEIDEGTYLGAQHFTVEVVDE